MTYDLWEDGCCGVYEDHEMLTINLKQMAAILDNPHNQSPSDTFKYCHWEDGKGIVTPIDRYGFITRMRMALGGMPQRRY